MSFSKRFALKERVIVVVAIGFVALISTSLLVQLNFSRFSDFAENFYQTQLPLVENAHDLEHASIRISALAKNLRYTDKQSDLDTLYLEFTREVKELEKLTAKLSVQGGYSDVLALNRLSQALAQEAKQIFASKVRQLNGSGITGTSFADKTLVGNSLQKSTKQLADLATEYRAQVETKLLKNSSDLQATQVRFSFLNLFVPFPISLLMFLSIWGLMRRFSLRTENLHSVLLGETATLNKDFFKSWDELSDLGLVAIEFQDQKRALELSKLEYERLNNDVQNIIDGANSPIFAFDMTQRITVWNRKAIELTKIDTDRVNEGMFLKDILCDECLSEFETRLIALSQDADLDAWESYLVAKDGRRIPVLCSLTSQLQSSRNKGEIFCIAQDLTQRNALQAEAIQASKLANLGEMATGMAHELNQPLNAMNITLASLRNTLKPNKYNPEKASTLIDRVANQVERASSIIDHMRIFGRRADDPVQVFEMGICINRAVNLLAPQLKLASIDLSLRIESNLLICGHAILFEQVILNLLSNAKFELEKRQVQNPWIKVEAARMDQHIVVSIEDNAGGIDEEVLPKIFEPFFTTKEAGKGTGLGLSISYGIIEEMSGKLAVNNSQNGAKFEIRFAANLDVVSTQNEVA